MENKKFNETFNTDFLSVSYEISRFEECMEFLALHEFNKVRGKEFIAFQSFSKVYHEANQDALMPDSRTLDLIKKLLQGTDSKTSVIVVSGIPGSGKGRASEYICR